MTAAPAIDPHLLQQISEAIRSIRYGTVQITVHNAQVVQIDKVERVRLTHTAPGDRTSGVSRPTHGP
ncbi:MAG: YezD family protein [Candidatus Omnitrophica bacterium]|nr:YezD family protein [Candidatus Omnitrophota bacterium]